MMQKAVLLVLVLSIMSCSYGDNNESTIIPSVATATVTENIASFWFPVENADREWEWGINIDNALEYAWLVRVSIMNETYEFGYSNFKFPGSGKRRDNLQQLLLNGQVDIWKLRADGGEIFVQGARGVTAFRKGNGITIQLTEPKFLNAFFSERPRNVVFITEGQMLKRKQETIKVTYVLKNDK